MLWAVLVAASNSEFWQVNVGQVLTVLAVLPGLWAINNSVVNKIKAEAEWKAKITDQVELLMKSRCPYGECPLRAHVNVSISEAEG
jgi:hypothetical protein